MSKRFDVAVVGATGLVGGSMLKVLAQRNFPVGKVYAVASQRSVGRKLAFAGGELEVRGLDDFDFSQVQIGLFSPGASVSDVYAPKAASQGCVVVDNTSRFRYEDDIPLVVPEVNADAIAQFRTRNIIANPNCSTIQMVVALKPIYDRVGIERINVATYQAVSGAGQSKMDLLAQQTRAWSEGSMPNAGEVPFAFNAIPQIDSFEDNGYTREEMKMVWETQKILGDEAIAVNATCVRVPVFVGHSEAVHIETRDPISASEATALLSKAPGVRVVDGEGHRFPTAVTDGAGSDEVFVGRIRGDISHPRGLNLWVVSDNVRKGAALNSVQIAEILADRYF